MLTSEFVEFVRFPEFGKNWANVNEFCQMFYSKKSVEKIANISSLDWCSSVRKSCIAEKYCKKRFSKYFLKIGSR